MRIEGLSGTAAKEAVLLPDYEVASVVARTTRHCGGVSDSDAHRDVGLPVSASEQAAGMSRCEATTAAKVRRTAAGLMLVLLATAVPFGWAQSASAAGSQYYVNTAHLCGWQWASLVHSPNYIDDIGENWSLSDPYHCQQGYDYPTNWLNTREDVYTGIYGGTINICLFGTAQSNPSLGAWYLAYDEPYNNAYDCGPNFYFGVNTSNMLTYGGWATGQMMHDLQH